MSDLIVETTYGKVQGAQKITALNAPYNAFLGIPYATPPVGSLRFKDPLPPSKWEGVYDATEEKSGCYEMNSVQQKILGSEDSLFLNIFTKDLKPKKPLPVMVYIFGGGMSGSSTLKSYSPDLLLMADVIIVTMNYRVGALGFLSLKDEGLGVPGNAGLKDQRLALKFVNDNIKNFGGDQNNITLFGHSFGAMHVSWHCASEGSRNLFHRAIIMSGSLLNAFAITPRKNWDYRLAVKLGYEGIENEREVLEFLQQADPMKIVEFQGTVLEDDDKNLSYLPFGPQIENFTSTNTFISGTPVKMQRAAWSHNIDILIGGVSDESLYILLDIKKDPKLLSDFKLESVVPAEVSATRDDLNVQAFVKNVKETYYPTSDHTKDELPQVKLMGDKFFWHGFLRLVQSRQNSGLSGKTFMYRFAVDSPTQNHYKNRKVGKEYKGVSHADDMAYIWKSIYCDVPGRDTYEFKAIQRFISLFTSFAATGNPTANLMQVDMQGAQAKPVDSLKPPFKGICIEQEEIKFGVIPESERMAIWNQLYEDTNTPLY